MHLEDFDRAAFSERRKRLRVQIVADQGLLPIAIFSSAPRIHNYRANPLPFRAASHFLYLVGQHTENAVLVLDGNGDTLYLPGRADDDDLWHGEAPSEQALGEHFGLRVVRRDLEHSTLFGHATLPTPDAEGRAFQEHVLGREVPYGVFAGRDRMLAHAMCALRLSHDELAQTQLRDAATVASSAHRLGIQITKPDMRERDVKRVMMSKIMLAEMSASYNPIVTVHGEVLHNHEYGNPMAAGDLLLADVGAESSLGFASDITRTWPVDATYSPTQCAIYEVVLKAQAAAIEKCVVGVRYRDIHLAAARALTLGLIELGIFRGNADELVADGCHALFFPHGIGHLLGLDVHDMEDLGDLAGYAPGRTRSKQFGLSYLRLDRDLAPNMAVTIEPGFYQVPRLLQTKGVELEKTGVLNLAELKRFSDVRGIRIEDDVLITDGAPEIISFEAPKSVAEIEALRAARY